MEKNTDLLLYGGSGNVIKNKKKIRNAVQWICVSNESGFLVDCFFYSARFESVGGFTGTLRGFGESWGNKRMEDDSLKRYFPLPYEAVTLNIRIMERSYYIHPSLTISLSLFKASL